ncbi:MAG: phosphoadenosine phosphosulfate reductase family protein, partial [Thermoanaerobaculia bacterium]
MLEIATAIRKIDQRDLLDEFEAGQLAVEFDDATPQEVIGWALERWGSQVAICTSFQAEGMAILDMAWRIDPEVRIFTVDTGRLPQETYDVMEEVRQRYGIEVEVYFPDAKQVENMVRRFGPNL